MLKILGLLNTSDVTKNVWSAVAAIVVLHLALGLYIFKAYSNVESSRDTDAVDKSFKLD